MEILSLQCELLAARTQLIAQTSGVPEDLEEAMASVVYCTKRIDIPELMDVILLANNNSL